jgi:hypothetical protein
MDWTLFRLKVKLDLLTPIGQLAFSAEEGRLDGDFGIFDLFHLGGQSITEPMFTSGLALNRVQQPALPAYLQMGDRMRVLRAHYGLGMLHFYFERSAAWGSNGGAADFQRVAGAEIWADDLLDFLPLRIGIHRPLDGAMDGRTVFTVNIPVILSQLLRTPMTSRGGRMRPSRRN